jgi:hypothetical protein
MRGVTELSCESEVSNLEDALLVKEKIGELEIPMDDELRVRVADLN